MTILNILNRLLKFGVHCTEHGRQLGEHKSNISSYKLKEGLKLMIKETYLLFLSFSANHFYVGFIEYFRGKEDIFNESFELTIMENTLTILFKSTNV